MTDKKETRTIDEAMAALDVMIEKLESRETTLEDSFSIYQEGIELLKYCSSRIDRVEKKMLQMNEEGELSEF